MTQYYGGLELSPQMHNEGLYWSIGAVQHRWNQIERQRSINTAPAYHVVCVERPASKLNIGWLVRRGWSMDRRNETRAERATSRTARCEREVHWRWPQSSRPDAVVLSSVSETCDERRAASIIVLSSWISNTLRPACSSVLLSSLQRLRPSHPATLMDPPSDSWRGAVAKSSAVLFRLRISDILL